MVEDRMLLPTHMRTHTHTHRAVTSALGFFSLSLRSFDLGGASSHVVWAALWKDSHGEEMNNSPVSDNGSRFSSLFRWLPLQPITRLQSCGRPWAKTTQLSTSSFLTLRNFVRKWSYVGLSCYVLAQFLMQK